MTSHIKVKVVTTEVRGAGSMVDKETGEVINWLEKTACKVWLPNEEYPSDYALKGVLPLGVGHAKLVFTLKKEMLRAMITDFELDAPAVPARGG